MLDLLNTIVQWIWQGLQNIFNILASIPVYIGKFTIYVNILPSQIAFRFAIRLTAIVIIKIKRLLL